jgi:hypothetical protein
VLGEENADTVTAVRDKLFDIARDVDHFLAASRTDLNKRHIEILPQRPGDAENEGTISELCVRPRADILPRVVC